MGHSRRVEFVLGFLFWSRFFGGFFVGGFFCVYVWVGFFFWFFVCVVLFVFVVF